MQNIEKALEIEVEQHGLNFSADARALPGMPPVGRGLTEDAAKYNLCVNLLYILADETGGNSGYKHLIIELLRKDMNKGATD